MFLSKKKLLLISLVQFACVEVQGQIDKKCKTDLDCNNPIKCAYCKWNKCEIFDNILFNPILPCQYNVTHCKNYCNLAVGKSLKTYEGYGDCVCWCHKSDYYGKQCQMKKHQGTMYPSGVNFITPARAFFNTPAPMLVTVREGPAPVLVIWDDMGGYLAQIKEPIKTKWGMKECQEILEEIHYPDKSMCDWLKDIDQNTIVYFIRFVIPFDFLTKEFERIISFPRKMEMKVWHPEYEWHTILSYHDHYYLATYPELKEFSSTPILRITGCGKNFRTIQQYKFNAPIHLAANFFYAHSAYSLTTRPDLGVEQKLTFKWEAYKFEGDTYHNPEITDFRYGDLTWDIEPYRWQGKYLINLTVDGYFQPQGSGQKPLAKKNSNFNTCLVEVLLTSLRAILSGGNTRFVYREHMVTLDASKSFDPNKPDDRSELVFTFSCNWTKEAVCRPVDIYSGEPKLTIIPKRLQGQKTYNFTLKVRHRFKYWLDWGFASQIIVVGELPKGKNATKDFIFLEDFNVECVYNCETESNPKDIVCLRVVGPWTRLYSLNFEWVQYEIKGDVQEKDSSIDSKKQSETPSFILIMNENTLKEDTKYEFKCFYNKSSQFVGYPITTTQSSKDTCKITPESGEAGVTIFKLACNQSESTKWYEFYDKFESDGPDYSGRMITYKVSGSIEVLVLTRGKLEIHSFDKYGSATIITIKVSLSVSNQTTSDIRKGLANVMPLSRVLGTRLSLRKISVFSDILLSSGKGGSGVVESVVKFLSELSINNFKLAKQGISTLYITLMAARGSLSLDGAWYASRAIKNLADALAEGLRSGHHCTFPVLYQVYTRILDCIYIVLEVKEMYAGKGTTALHFINPVIYKRVKVISRYVIKISSLLQSALSYKHLPTQKEKLIESSLGNLSMWIKVDLPTALSDFTMQEHSSKKFPVIVPENLAQYVKNMGYYLGLQFMTFKEDPTWIETTNTDNNIHLFVCFKDYKNKTCRYPRVLKYGIQVAFDIAEFVKQMDFTNLTLKRLDNRLISKQLDIELPVYKIDPLPLADVEAHFKFYSNNSELVVLVNKDKRPTYKSLMKKHIKVIPTYPLYPVVADPFIKPHLYYFGIQPGAQINVNETMSFEVKMISKICYSWQEQWEPNGCQAIQSPNTDDLICECTMLSLVGGFVNKVNYKLESFEDFPMSMSISSFNETMFVSQLLLLLLILLLAIVCAKADQYDKRKRFVSILPDNFPYEKFGYLVRVVTGARVGAGTDASVGIKMHGKYDDSRNHILTNASYDVMERMGEDWFLLYEHHSIGRIESLDVWHDCTGVNSNWFCDTITVYDLHNNNCYIFIVNDWLDLSLKRFPEACILPSKSSEITGLKMVFLEYLSLGFQLSHLWFDTIIRHPRDAVSRTDRLGIILCFILVAMASSIIFIEISDEYVEVDDYSFSVTWLMIEMSVYTCIPAAATACLLMLMFRRVYKIIFYIEKRKDKTTNQKVVARVSVQEDYLLSPSSTALGTSKRFIHYGHRHKHTPKTEEKATVAETINLRLIPKALVPVQIKGDKPNVIINRIWLISTWTAVTVIVVICIFISIKLSQNMPPVKTIKWFTVVFLTIIIHAIILLPLKIIMVSALLALAFKRIMYKDVYTFDPKDGLQKEHFGEVSYLIDIVYLRNEPMYQPLREEFRAHHRNMMVRARQWRSLYELIIQIMFLVVLGTILRLPIPIQNQTNYHLHTLIKVFDKVHNTSDLKRFHEFCEPYFYRYIWYNWELLSHGPEKRYHRKDWMNDNVNRMLGNVYMRQFRVKPGYCKAPLNLSTDCAPSYSWSAVDKVAYLPFWSKPGNITKEQFEEEFLSEWSFLRPREDSNFYLDGATGQTYPSGGYTWDLGATRVDMDASLVNLWGEGWIGHYTRAVLLQVIVYNVNTHLFSEITFISEQTVAGEILSTTITYSVDIDIQFDWWLTWFITLTLIQCARVFKLANAVGVFGLFANWRRPYEVLVTVSALSALLYYLLHLLSEPQYVADFQHHSDEIQFFNFYEIAHYEFHARVLLCVLYILNIIRFYSLWRFGKNLLRIYLAIVHSIVHVTWLILLFLVLQLLLFRFVGYLLLCFIDTFFNPNMAYKRNYLYYPVRNETSGFQVLCFLMNLSSTFIILFITAIFVYEFKTSKAEFIKLWVVANYFTLIYDDIKKVIEKPIVRRQTIKLVSKSVVQRRATRKTIDLKTFEPLKNEDED